MQRRTAFLLLLGVSISFFFCTGAQGEGKSQPSASEEERQKAEFMRHLLSEGGAFQKYLSTHSNIPASDFDHVRCQHMLTLYSPRNRCSYS